MKYIAIIVGLLLVIPVFGQRKKKDDEALVAPTYVEGVVYSLPRTGVKIYVDAVKEVFEPGPYAGYAEQLLGIKDAKNRATVKWEIKDVKIQTFSEPDPDQVYKAMGDAAFLVSLTPEGCLAGINTQSTSGEVQKVKTNTFIEKPEMDDGFSFDNFTDTPFYIPGDSTNGFRPMRIGADQKAAEAAKRILKSRMNQYDIAAGLLDEFHPDGNAYKVSIEKLEKIEKQYLSLFVGRVKYQKQSFSFDYVPTSGAEKGEVVFRFSEEKGAVPANDMSGKPVTIKVKPEKNLTGKYAGLAKSENPTAGESGVYYRMPGMVDLEVSFELKTIASARTAMAQFGTVATIPEELLYGEYSVEIHPETGAIKSIVKK